MVRVWILLAALGGALAVALGAYGAHALVAPPGRVEMFRTAVSYQMWHVLALLAAAWLRPAQGPALAVRLADLAGALFTAGTILFSGSLYAIGLTGRAPVPMAAPAGGLALIGGWLALAACGLLRR